MLAGVALAAPLNAFAQVSGGLPPIQERATQNLNVDTAQTSPALPPVSPKPDESLRTMQETLNKMGYTAGLADGFWGPQTESAIIAAERDLGLPSTGKPSTALSEKLNNAPVQGRFSKTNLRSIGQSTLGYDERVKKYRSEIGRSIYVIRSMMSGELSNPKFLFPALASNIQGTQTWWVSGSEVNMVFENNGQRPITGLVLTINGDSCNPGGRSHTRYIRFSMPIEPNSVTATYFPWENDLPSGGVCLDVVDVIFN